MIVAAGPSGDRGGGDPDDDPGLERPLVAADPGARRSTATLTLGTQQFLGQFVSDWNAVLAALTVAIIPMLVLYVVFNRQFIRGLMGGALK